MSKSFALKQPLKFYFVILTVCKKAVKQFFVVFQLMLPPVYAEISLIQIWNRL